VVYNALQGLRRHQQLPTLREAECLDRVMHQTFSLHLPPESEHQTTTEEHNASQLTRRKRKVLDSRNIECQRVAMTWDVVGLKHLKDGSNKKSIIEVIACSCALIARDQSHMDKNNHS
jgi:hypothetical protein